MADNANWYVVHTYSGYENTVKATIEKYVDNRNLQDLIHEISIPMETVTEVTDNGVKEVERKVFPGYVLVKMIKTTETWYIVRNTRGVTGFVGPGSRPTPLTDEEVNALNIEDEVQVKLSFAEGDTVDIIDGLFEGYSGTVQTVSEDMKTATVLVRRGRRDMPVELECSMLKLANKNA